METVEIESLINFTNTVFVRNSVMMIWSSAHLTICLTLGSVHNKFPNH